MTAHTETVFALSLRRWATPMTPLQLGDLQNWIDMGRLKVPQDRLLTMKDIVDAGMMKAGAIKHGIKLLGKVSPSRRDPCPP
jgi:hypothetical protein